MNETVDIVLGPRGAEDYPIVEPWSFAETLRREKASLGFYVSGHPLDRYGDLGRTVHPVLATSALSASEPHARVCVAGMIEDYHEKIFREGGRVSSFSLEDQAGRVFVRVPGKLVDAFSVLLATATEPMIVQGKVTFPFPEDDAEGSAAEEPFLTMEDARPLAEALRQETRHVILRADARRITRVTIAELGALLARHPGPASVGLVLRLEDGTEAILNLPKETRVEASSAFVEAVEKLFGA